MRKGQTALEYLVTYGWAILVILVVLAVLWYYGIFNPSTWGQQQVVHGSAFQSVDFKVTAPSSVTLVLGNKVGNTVQVTAISLSGDLDNSGTFTTVITAGGEGTFDVPAGTKTVTTGDTISFDVTVTYDDQKTGVTGKTDILKYVNIKVG